MCCKKLQCTEDDGASLCTTLVMGEACPLAPGWFRRSGQEVNDADLGDLADVESEGEKPPPLADAEEERGDRLELVLLCNVILLQENVEAEGAENSKEEESFEAPEVPQNDVRAKKAKKAKKKVRSKKAPMKAKPASKKKPGRAAASSAKPSGERPGRVQNAAGKRKKDVKKDMTKTELRRQLHCVAASNT